uniref:allophycocyanin beta 18 subunit n=1 Tax=Porphyridium aerugineum TaxID=2792 RepID=UPI001FCD4D37|nr:allophycocyanin beta 18 subunit [Porphyridium aerugineum]UNJ17986.1 allophycocyanin beta 18 subunit [Porphyridium aerugineum]
MQDAISSVINQYDLSGKYLDSKAINELSTYFNTGIQRLKIAGLINKEAGVIVKEAADRLFVDQPELLRPCGNAFIGNAYTTRRYAACVRDIEYYLRYSSYSIVAGTTDVLDERVLDGLKETYNSLSVPIGPTVTLIRILEDIIIDKFSTNSEEIAIISKPFRHLIVNLSEKNI